MANPRATIKVLAHRALSCFLGAISFLIMSAVHAEQEDVPLFSCSKDGRRLYVSWQGHVTEDLRTVSVNLARLRVRGQFDPKIQVWWRAKSKSVVRRCGPLAIKVSLGFVNSNPMGELGAVEFATVEISRNHQVLVPEFGLETCDVGLSRFKYFGDCPERYAAGLSLEIDKADSCARIRIKRSFIDAALRDREMEETIHIALKRMAGKCEG